MKNKVAKVRFSCGRWYLLAGKWVVAVEGDICRDFKKAERHWDKKTLKRAAKAINKKVKNGRC